MSTTFETVRQAMASRQIVVGVYDGHPREMCPHCLGYGKAGEEMALFYQFGGTSRSGAVPQWKCMRLAGLQIIEVHAGQWQTGTDHGKPQVCVKQVVAEVMA